MARYMGDVKGRQRERDMRVVGETPVGKIVVIQHNENLTITSALRRHSSPSL